MSYQKPGEVNTSRSMEWKKANSLTFKNFHIADESKIKLDDKSEKLMFIGYDSKSKGYRLYNPKS